MIDARTGEPQIYYHGTNRQFDEMKHPSEHTSLSNNGLDHDQQGIYLSDSAETVRQHADPLGSENTFNEVMQQFLAVAEEQSWEGAVKAWDGFQASCIARDGDVTITNPNHPEQPIQLDDLNQAIQNGQVGYDGYVFYRGKRVGLLGELQQIFGGELPRPGDQLESYESLFDQTQKIVQALKTQKGLEIKVPKRVKPRILSYYVRATNPLEETITVASPQSMDNALARGIDTAASSQGSLDAVLIHSSQDGLDSGTNLVVFNPNQLKPADEVVI